ncbi:MAG: cytochrome P450 [Candidatus Dormibacteraeota bacterium]|nr:cytochrome P450 [Candidatus Dormibacteraeota bacterium]
MAVALDEIDLSDTNFWLESLEFREAAFALLRREAPVKFFAELPFEVFPAGPGYWALTRYDDIWHASRNPQLFCSGKGSNIPDLPIEISEFFGSMINMDDPKHARLRGIVQKGFTPKMIKQAEDYVRERATSVIDSVIERFPEGTCDFVAEIAAPLPLEVICDMMGIPSSDTKQIFTWTNVILGAGDPEYGGAFDKFMQTALEIFAYAQALGQDRLDHPRDDLTSSLMHAELDGQRLTPQEFGSFFILLVVAGNETTRNAISHGMAALTDYPDQRRIWWDDFATVAPTAVEEIVRWATPVIHFRRTATADTEIRGMKIAEGDKVVYWYNSANRDEDKFANPGVFDVRRSPNPQLGYGAGGPHFCLGANLARREITVMFDEIHRRLPNLVIMGEPARLQSPFINGIKRLPCAWK